MRSNAAKGLIVTICLIGARIFKMLHAIVGIVVFLLHGLDVGFYMLSEKCNEIRKRI